MIILGDVFIMSASLYKLFDWQDTRVYNSQRYLQTQDYWHDLKFKIFFILLMIAWVAIGIFSGSIIISIPQ